ncbi:MAG: TolC family protein, partial [Gammaproteobacteria bacterium]
ENTDVDKRTIGISQSIDWGGKRSARTAVAESKRLAVEAEYLQIRRAVTLELLSGLAQHHTTVERNALAEERERLMDEFAALARHRFEAGDLNQVEFDLAALAFANAKMKKATAAVDLAEARQIVRNIAPNSKPADWPTLADRVPEAPNAAIDLMALVMTLPEVQAAYHRVGTANKVIELRKREQRSDPTINLVGGKDGDETLIGLSLSIPLPIRNRYTHEVAAAAAESRRVEQVADDILHRAHARLISAAERYQLSQGAWRDWERTGRVSLNRLREQLGRLWEAGEISTADYLVQLRQTVDVQESALHLRQSLWRAWFEWLAASGRVDEWLGLGAAQ